MTTSKEDADVTFRLAYEAEEKGDLKKSLELRQALVKYSPHDEHFILSLARSYSKLNNMEQAEWFLRKAIFLYPYSELSSLQLFHFLWTFEDKDKAFEEMKRFQSIAFSQDYADIVKEIGDKN